MFKSKVSIFWHINIHHIFKIHLRLFLIEQNIYITSSIPKVMIKRSNIHNVIDTNKIFLYQQKEKFDKMFVKLEQILKPGWS